VVGDRSGNFFIFNASSGLRTARIQAAHGTIFFEFPSLNFALFNSK